MEILSLFTPSSETLMDTAFQKTGFVLLKQIGSKNDEIKNAASVCKIF
jgi:hypothetical protein